MLTLPFGTLNEQVEFVELAMPLQIVPLQLVNVKPSSGVACRTTSVLKSSEDVQSVWPLSGPPPQSNGSVSGSRFTTLPFGLLTSDTVSIFSTNCAVTLSVLPSGTYVQVDEFDVQ